MKYADDTIQAYVSPWWITNKKKDFQRGRLIKAPLPHVHQVPFTLIPKGRGDDPTNHSQIRYTMKELELTAKRNLSSLPAAALTLYEGEIVLGYRGKYRPAFIVSSGGEEIPEDLTAGKPAWQTTPTILVAPYYGVERNLKRAGFNKEFVERVKRAEYPNFYWDMLPIPGSDSDGSICKLDHILPLGKYYKSVEFTEHCLSDEALEMIDQWLTWLFSGIEPYEGDFQYLRENLREIQEI